MDAHNVIWPVKVSAGLIEPEPWSQWLASGGRVLRRAS
jgi:hypothetical protein